MHNLSLMASAAPKAQQEPQVDWSLTSLILSQPGHYSLESKFSGKPFIGTTSFSGNLSSSGSSKIVPIYDLIDSRVNDSHLAL